MVTQVKAWGNGQAVRLSKELLDIAGIKVNDKLNVEYVDGNIVLHKTFKHKTIEQRVEESGKPLTIAKNITFNEATGREIW